MRRTLFIVSLFAALLLSGCMPESLESVHVRATVEALSADVDALHREVSGAAETETVILGDPDVSYTLRTGSDGDRLVFYGVGGDIDGMINPTLTADPGQIVQITLINGQPVEHDLMIDKLGVAAPSVLKEGDQSLVQFRADDALATNYFCSLPGHRAAGMEGLILIGDAVADEGTTGEMIVRDPNVVPAPIGDREPQIVEVELEAVELEGQLADGTTYTYFTFNGQVPGPFIRVRVGDTVQLTLTNSESNANIHSIDLHAVNGPGGGAVYSQVNPGDSKTFTFTTLRPGIFVYHCATPSVPHHISSGMYGLILVEPEGGLPPVDHEYYVMQGEIYTTEPFGTKGHLEHDQQAMLDEDAEYIVFNGMAGGLTLEDYALRATAGDTVRIYFGVGGPNYTSAFHVIGEMFDRVYTFGSLTSDTLTDVQTIVVAPGSAWAVELTIEEPGNYILVDHALSRLERGLVGYIVVDGQEDVDVFHEGPAIP